jgi:effector-binding domain-containing protein
MSVESIMHLIKEEENTQALLEKQRSILLNKQNEIQKMLSELDILIKKCPEQKYTARIVTVEKRLVYYCRGYIASVESIHNFIKSCAAELARTNPDVRLSEPDYCCVIYPDDGYRESGIFIEYAQSVDRVGADTETLKFKEIEPITAVSVTHRGAYGTLRDAYLFAVNWAEEHGYRLIGEPRERYIHGAWDRKEESEWVTELQLPVMKK